MNERTPLRNLSQSSNSPYSTLVLLLLSSLLLLLLLLPPRTVGRVDIPTGFVVIQLRLCACNFGLLSYLFSVFRFFIFQFTLYLCLRMAPNVLFRSLASFAAPLPKTLLSFRSYYSSVYFTDDDEKEEERASLLPSFFQRIRAKSILGSRFSLSVPERKFSLPLVSVCDR